MQKQAAPYRFKGFYENDIEIPTQYIPNELKYAIKQYNLRYNPDYKTNHKIKYPRLLLRINDPEIQSLAKDKHDCLNPKQFKIDNKNYLATFNNFDKIDCKDITCDCCCRNDYDYEQIYGKENNMHNETVILYRTCKRTIFAAAKRQIKSAPTPDYKTALDFIAFGKDKIEEYLGDDLTNFGYSYNQWFNHLNSEKQRNMLLVKEKLDQFTDDIEAALHDPEFLKLFHYEGICKKELQNYDGKPRMVCKIPDIVKYVMGPICWKLEEIFTDHLPCYCGGMNLTQMQDKINNYIDEGYTMVAEGDGSAFDNTQDVMLKELDRYVYERVADKVYHVPIELFRYCAMQYYKIMDIVNTDPICKKRKTLMTYAVLGTVFSGDCDTTLMNTMRMGLYNWYTNERNGLQFHKDYICFSKGDDFTVMYHYKYDTEFGRYMIEQSYRKYWLAKYKPKGDQPEYDNRQHGLGQILKFIEFGQPNTIKFCSLRAWYLNPQTSHIYLTRDPQKFYGLGKFSRKLRTKNCKEAINYIIDQAIALKANYAGLDFFENIIQNYLQAAYEMTVDNFDVILRQRVAIARDRRQTLPLEIDDFDTDCLLFNKTPRHDDFKIKVNESYWGSQQRAERAQLQKLTPDEIYYINSQINVEFDPISYDYLA